MPDFNSEYEMVPTITNTNAQSTNPTSGDSLRRSTDLQSLRISSDSDSHDLHLQSNAPSEATLRGREAKNQSWFSWLNPWATHEYKPLNNTTSGGNVVSATPTSSHFNPYEINLPNSTAFSSFLNMTNSIVGADWTINLLVHTAKLSGTHNYQDLAHFCFGKSGLIIISVAQFLFAFGGMCAYTVIIGDTIPNVLKELLPDSLQSFTLVQLLISRNFLILFLTLVISYPLSLLRDISKLANASFLALVAMLIIVVAVIIEGPYVPEELRGSPQLNWSIWNPEMFQGVAVIAFALVCHHNSFVIFADLEKPTLDRFAMVTHLSTGISMFFCAIMAIAGYITFTDRTQGNILNNFPADSLLINLARFCFGLNMFSTFPLEHYVAREVIENYFYPNGVTPFRSFLLTSILVGISLALALATCDLGFVMELTGGLSASVLAFILPAACYLKLSPLPLRSIRHLPHWILLTFGVLTMVLSTGLSLRKMYEGMGEASQTC